MVQLVREFGPLGFPEQRELPLFVLAELLSLSSVPERRNVSLRTLVPSHSVNTTQLKPFRISLGAVVGCGEDYFTQDNVVFELEQEPCHVRVEREAVFKPVEICAPLVVAFGKRKLTKQEVQER